MKFSFKTIQELEAYKPGPKIETTEEDLNQLRKSLQENGFLSPVIIQNSQIVDGNTRLNIAKELGITLIPCLEIESDTDPEVVSLTLNLARRHMSINQKTEIIARLIELVQEKKIKVENVEKYKDQRGTNAIVATMTGTSPATVAKVKKITQVDPEIIKRVSSNEISLEKAYQSIKEKKSKNEQQFREIAKQNSEQTELMQEIKEAYKQILNILYEKDSLITISNASKLMLFASVIIKKLLPYLSQLPAPDQQKVYDALNELNSQIQFHTNKYVEEVI